MFVSFGSGSRFRVCARNRVKFFRVVGLGRFFRVVSSFVG